MTEQDAIRIIRECRQEISFMATQPYGYLNIQLLEKRILELEDFLGVYRDNSDSGVESFA